MPQILVAITGPATCGKSVISETFLSDGIEKVSPIPQITSRPKRDDDNVQLMTNISEKEFAESSFFIRHGKYGISYHDMVRFSQSDAKVGVVIVGAIEMEKLRKAVAIFSDREGVDIELYKVLMLFSRKEEGNYGILIRRINSFFSGEELRNRISINTSLLRNHFLQEGFRRDVDHICYLEDKKLPDEIVKEILIKINLESLVMNEKKVIDTANAALGVRSEINESQYKDLHYVTVSTEDDKYRCAGGIGTAVALQTEEMAKRGVNTVWITQSPDNTNFEENVNGVRRMYVSRYDDGNYLSLDDFRVKINDAVKNHVDKTLNDPNAKVIAESPEWEGLLSTYFNATKDQRVTKISRTHTPLIHTLSLNNIVNTKEVESQLEREKKQLVNSNIISSPTEYMLERINHHFPGLKHLPIEQVVIPNCININDFANYEYPSREKSIENLKNFTGANISADNFNIFVLGSVEKRKGVDDVLAAFNMLGEADPKVNMYLVGNYNKDGDSLTANTKYTEHDVFSQVLPELQDRVHVLGFIDHSKLPEIIKAGDVYAFAYKADNFPGSLIEVGLSDTPIVAVGRGGITEMVTDQNRQALCPLIPGVSERLHSELSEAILKAPTDKSLPSEMKKYLVEKYNPAQTVDKMLTSYAQTRVVSKSI